MPDDRPLIGEEVTLVRVLDEPAPEGQTWFLVQRKNGSEIKALCKIEWWCGKVRI